MIKEVHLSDDDVISITGEDRITQHPTAKVSEIKAAIGRDLLPKYLSWLIGGVNCRVLRLETGRWQRGKIRIRLEYFPYESELTPEADDLTKPDV